MPESKGRNQKKCPFYGFVGVLGEGVFMDNRGNACGLTGEHRPCAMEIADQVPDWKNCAFFNHPANRARLVEIMNSNSVQFFPEQLSPGGDGSAGTPPKEWYRLVMGEEFK